MFNKPILRLTQESIDFQNDQFGNKIESIIREIDDLDKSSEGKMSRDSKALKVPMERLNKLVKDRLGLTISFVLNTYCPGAIMTFPVNKNHILLKDIWRDNFEIHDQEELLKTFNNKKGTIDMTTGKVGGIFSEYEHSLYCDILGNLGFGLNYAEITAIIMHELGHAETYYELSDRLRSTNQIMADLSITAKEGVVDKKKRTYLFKELAKELRVSEDTFDDLTDESSRMIFGVRLFKRYMDSVTTIMYDGKYDETSSEQVADNFATRFGYGKSLVSALNKLHAYSPEKSFVSRFIIHFVDLLILFGLIAMMFVSVGGFLIAFFYLSLAIICSGEKYRDMTYDELKYRYIRIRQQLIQRIKDSNLSKKDIESILDDLETIDFIIKNTSSYSQIFTKLSNVLLPMNWSVSREIACQQLMESISNNELFISAARLSTLSK